MDEMRVRNDRKSRHVIKNIRVARGVMVRGGKRPSKNKGTLRPF